MEYTTATDSVENTKNSKDKEYQAILKLAASLHDMWRLTRKKQDGTYDPRIKKDDNGKEIDIANTNFSELPKKWQNENLAAAELAVTLVQIALSEGVDVNSPQFLEDFSMKVHTLEGDSSYVHGNWRRRNPKVDDNEMLHIAYLNLSEEEKQKDRDQIMLAIKFLSNGPNIALKK